MSKKIHLSENHIRSLSSSLTFIEKSLSELEGMLLKHNNSCCNMLIKDIEDEKIASNLTAIKEAKSQICELAEKYGISQEKISLQRVLNAKRTAIWEILTDTRSGKKGYGTFPKKYAAEYDGDINKLLEKINNINC